MRTLSDLHDRLRAYVGNDVSAEKSAAVTRAAAEAVNSIASKADWLYYRTWGRLSTSAPYSTGTVAFDLTGGAYERMLTLTGGTWPTWANYGTVVIDTVPYDVDRRISDTIVTLKALTSPSGDIAAGTSYNMYRMRYDLPADFQALQKPVITTQNFQLQKVTLETIINRRNYNDSDGTPLVFTIVDSGYDRKQLIIWYPPDAEYTMEFEYKRKPVFPVVVQESAGKIALTSGSTALTGTSTQFTAAMAGAVLRVSYNQTVPGSFDSNTPPEYEYVLDTYTSATAMVLKDAASATVSNRAYTISSRVDVADGPMFQYLVEIGRMELRKALRINLIPGELDEYTRIAKAAISSDGQAYAGSDQAAVAQVCRPNWNQYISSRTIPGNG